MMTKLKFAQNDRFQPRQNGFYLPHHPQKDGALLAEGCSRNVFTDNNGHIIRLSGDFYDRINAFYQKEQAEEKH